MNTETIIELYIGLEIALFIYLEHFKCIDLIKKNHVLYLRV